MKKSVLYLLSSCFAFGLTKDEVEMYSKAANSAIKASISGKIDDIESMIELFEALPEHSSDEMLVNPSRNQSINDVLCFAYHSILRPLYVDEMKCSREYYETFLKLLNVKTDEKRNDGLDDQTFRRYLLQLKRAYLSTSCLESPKVAMQRCISLREELSSGINNK